MGYAASRKLLEENLVPEPHKERVVTNMKSYEQIVSNIQQGEIAKRMQEDAEKIKEKREEKENRRNKEKKSTKTTNKKKYKKRK
jgi:hypothetical protein